MIIAMVDTDGSMSRIPRKQTPYSAKETIKIYTDWANHYLEKAKSRRFVQDLQVDVSDGVLLADVIEAVTNEKVRDINRKPSSFSQAIDNINSSLMFLANLGVNVDGIAARDIRDGNLKAILGLFFSLSRHKQQQKQAAVAAAASAAAVSAATASTRKNSGGSMIVANGGGASSSPAHAKNATPTKAGPDSASSRLPSPFRQSTRLSTPTASKDAVTSSNIPFPVSTSGGLRKPTAGAPPGGGPSHLPGGVVSGRTTTSASSSRSTSPSAVAGHSFLPQPTVKSPLVKQQVPHSPVPPTTCPTSSLRSSSAAISGGRNTPVSNVTLRSNNNNNNNNNNQGNGNNNDNNAGKNSMLDKFKFFNSKDKNDRGGVSKRTSSSSGFSSARSERSDSSNSLCSEPKGTSVSGTSGPKCSSSQTASSSTTTRESSPTNVASSPKANSKALAKKTIDRSTKGNQTVSTNTGSSSKVVTKRCTTSLPTSGSGFALAPLEPDQVVRESRISSILSKTGSCNSSNACRTSQSITASVAGEATADMFPSSVTVTTGGGSPAGTGIPKPTAAVKGTSKVAKDDRSMAAQQQQAALQLRLQKESVKPVGAVSPPSRSSSRSSLRGDSVDRSASGGARYHHDGASVALVSPMPNCQEESILTINMVPSDHVGVEEQMRPDHGKPPKPSHGVRAPTSSQGHGKTACTRSKVETTFDGDDKVITRETGLGGTRVACLSRETTFSEEPEDFSVNVKPMAPITTRAPPYGYSRGLSAYSTSGRALLSSLHLSPRVGTVHSDGSSASTSVHGAGSTLARLGCHLLSGGDALRMYAGSLKRGMDTEYHSDMDCMDFASGYMSDGDVLRGGLAIGHGHGVVTGTGPSMTGVGVGLGSARMVDDIASGYLSEGGASLYARRMNSQCRLRDGLAAVKECMQKSSGYLHDDSFDDSSSVSSGISDTIAEISTDENLTGSSVGSDQANNANNPNAAFGSLKRIQHDNGPGGSICLSPSSHRLGGGLCAANLNANDRACRLATVVEGHHHHHHVTNKQSQGIKVVPSSPSSGNVRKTDSSQQTDNSVFRSSGSSSSGLKKGGEKEGLELLRRGKSDLEPGRKRSSSNNSQTSSSGGILRKSSNSGEKKSPSTALSPKSKRKGFPPSAVDCATGGTKTGVVTKKSSSQCSGMGSRAGACPPTISSCAAGSKRPTSTCSVSSNGSSSGSRSVSSRLTSSSKRSSSERLSESQLVDEALRLVQVSGIPRPGKAELASNSCNGSRKPKVKVSANTQTANSQDLYGLAGGDPEFSRGSLGRRHRQHPSSGCSPSSTRTSASSGLFAAGARSSCGSPRLSLSTRSHDGTENSPAPYSPSYSWLRPSTSLAAAAAAARHGTLTEAESVELLSAGASSSSHHGHHARAAADRLTQARLMMHHREISPSPRLTRSSSIRSTKSEKLYPSMLQRSDDLDAYLNSPMSMSVHTSNNSGHTRIISQPTSPTPGVQNNARLGFVMSSSPSHAASGSSRASSAVSPYVGGLLSKIAKDDELHGSSLSLVSTTSSLYSTPEEKHNHEVRKLRRELMEAQEKVHTLTTQLTTNAHVVAAFEQSLSNMTTRLQSLTASAERKDSELNDLRATIDDLRKQSVEAGLTTANYQSTSQSNSPNSPFLIRRHTLANCRDSGVQERRMSRQLSTDSVSSMNSLSSACSAASQKSMDVNGKKKKKKGWLRSSFSKAFSRGKRNKHGSVSDVEDLRQFQSDTSTPNSPLLTGPHPLNGGIPGIKSSRSSSAIYNKDNDSEAPEVVQELEKQLREKDMVLTDIRLEALSSAHQLEFLKDTVTKMRSDMINLKQDNDRLQRIVSTKSLTSSQSSLVMPDSSDRRLSYTEMSAQSTYDILRPDGVVDKDGKLVPVSVFLGVSGDHPTGIISQEGPSAPETMIGSVLVSGKTKWDTLDGMIRRTFKEYVLRVDPASNLGLSAESVVSYQLGEIIMSSETELPELLPYGYLVGDNLQIRVALKGGRQSTVDALAFDTLIPKAIIQRYISLLTEHRRIILCGPSGTGKTYLAHKLGDFLVVRSGKSPTPGTVAMFNVDHKSAKELRQYLANVAEQCENNVSELPSVIILDNLHHVGSLGEVFNGFLSAKYQKCPYIIGTMNQATCSTTNLQLHHNFRWVLCANHMEPVKGFLGRYLRRKLIECEVQCAGRNCELLRVMDWIPKVWQHLNKFLEAHSSSDVTIGPRLFLACPLDLSGSQVWFTDLWNYSLVPYILEAVREGLQLYGRRAPWEDPTEWVMKNYPWPATTGQTSLDWTSLLRLRPEDVGYEGHPGPSAMVPKTSSALGNEMEGDPLLNMLMRLQEAASYSSPHSNDSDSTSLESGNSSSLHSDDALVSIGLESNM